MRVMDETVVSVIQQMMYKYGDCQKPMRECAELVEDLLRQQISSLLLQCGHVATNLRKCSVIGHEDILFIMRRDKVKLKRLLKYLELKDLEHLLKKKGGVSSGALCKSKKSKRLASCLDFLSTIDQTGELSSIMSDDIVDTVKHERAVRLNYLAESMSAEQYLSEFEKIKKSGFGASNFAPVFKIWLQEHCAVEKELTQLAHEILLYLAQETVAQVVDLALLVKQDSQSKYLQKLASASISKHPIINEKTDVSPYAAFKLRMYNQDCIKPEEVREAIRRYFKQPGPFTLFSKVYESNMKKCLLTC